MQLKSIIKKENLVLLKSWQSYLIALFVPIIMLLVNLYISSSGRNISIKIGYVDDDFIANNELVQYISEYVQKYGIEYNYIKCSSTNIDDNKSIDLIIDILDNSQMKIYANLNNDISRAGAQYFVYAVQQLNSTVLIERYPNELQKIQDLQPYKLPEIINVDGKSDNIQSNTITLFSILWILLYFPLNTSINQMFQEKQQKTMYYLCKSSVSKFKILFGKLIAVVFQSFLILGIFFIAVKLFKQAIFEISFINIIYSLIILTCICNLGYLLGLLFNSASVTTVISLILFLPVTLSTTLQSSLAINNILKLLPTYYCASLLNDMMRFQHSNVYNIIIICLFSLLFFVLSNIIFMKKEPAKLCKYEE